MVFKDYLYFQINKFMRSRNWSVLFLFLTHHFTEIYPLKFLVDPMDISITWVTKGFAPDPSFYQLCFIASQGRADYLPGSCSALAAITPPLGETATSFSTLPPQNASSVISFPHHPILSISSEHQTSIVLRVSLHKCICYSPPLLNTCITIPIDLG